MSDDILHCPICEIRHVCKRCGEGMTHNEFSGEPSGLCVKCMREVRKEKGYAKQIGLIRKKMDLYWSMTVQVGLFTLMIGVVIGFIVSIVINVLFDLVRLHVEGLLIVLIVILCIMSWYTIRKAKAEVK